MFKKTRSIITKWLVSQGILFICNWCGKRMWVGAVKHKGKHICDECFPKAMREEDKIIQRTMKNTDIEKILQIMDDTHEKMRTELKKWVN